MSIISMAVMQKDINNIFEIVQEGQKTNFHYYLDFFDFIFSIKKYDKTHKRSVRYYTRRSCFYFFTQTLTLKIRFNHVVWRSCPIYFLACSISIRAYWHKYHGNCIAIVTTILILFNYRSIFGS